MNLMCPARILLPLPGTPPQAFAGERITAVYAAVPTPAASTLAADLGVALTVLDDPAGQLQEISDAHRGETVVLLDADLGVRLPAVVEHTGDGWTSVVAENLLQAANAVTVQTYEQRADSFRSTIPRDPNDNLIRLVDKALPARGTVLELGSGTGRDAAELERRGHQVRRTDATLAFVEMMRDDGFKADQLNALTDDYGGPYDLVFADAVFLHFSADQLENVLTRCAEAAPLLAFTTREGEGIEWSNRFLELPRQFTLWEEGPLRALLTGTGWQVRQLDRGETRAGGWFHILADRAAA
ncbi:class I SAM-dependent methyltransferase [Kribbella sp. DT2]|uniref:class I SAM-dependent methyltransferase n=1 Tax=Kribbella sp. DT2 TaxID=3393427 RepID=UPI003CF5B953